MLILGLLAIGGVLVFRHMDMKQAAVVAPLCGLAITRRASRFLVVEAVFYLYNASTNQDWVRIYPEQGCLNSQHMAYDDDVGFAPATATSTAHESVNGSKTRTTASINYCKEGAEPASS